MAGGARDGEAGVMLLEALIWVALLAMLALMIADGASLTTRAWNSAERQANEVDEMETTRSFLRRTIASAQPALRSADPSDTRIVFDGQARQLILVAPRSGQRQAGEWVLQSLYVAPRDDGSALLLDWGPQAALGARSVSGSADASRAPVLQAVRAVRFGYFGPPAGGGQADWQDEWRDRTVLPDLVRMILERAEGAGDAWPELVVATRVDANAACRFDPRNTDCQRGPQ